MKQTYPIYYICDKNNRKLIQFEIFFMPKDFVIPKAEILVSDISFPEVFSFMKPEDAVYLYLHSCLQDYGVRGYQLDDMIVERLKLSEHVRCFGRLNGMEYLIDLLDRHFYNEENEWYVTCKEPHTISFFWCIPGWNRLFIDQPVTMEEITNKLLNIKETTNK